MRSPGGGRRCGAGPGAWRAGSMSSGWASSTSRWVVPWRPAGLRSSWAASETNWDEPSLRSPRAGRGGEFIVSGRGGRSPRRARRSAPDGASPAAVIGVDLAPASASTGLEGAARGHDPGESSPATSTMSSGPPIEEDEADLGGPCSSTPVEADVAANTVTISPSAVAPRRLGKHGPHAVGPLGGSLRSGSDTVRGS